jgi:hypothetical protein
MSRARLPRRFGLLVAFACVGTADFAWAQRSAQRPVTVIGRDSDARACGQGVAANDLSAGTLEACDRALRNNRFERDDRIRVRINRGVLHLRLHQNETALAQALELGETDPQTAYFNRAAACEALGDVRSFYEDYATALEIQSGWELANTALARFARQRQAHLASMLIEEPTP